MQHCQLFISSLAAAILVSLIGLSKSSDANLSLKDLESTLIDLKLTHFLELLHSSELKHLLHERDRVTLFAPTNEALHQFELENSDKDLSKNDKFSSNLLKYHIVDGVPNLWSTYFRNEELLPTILWGTSIRLNIQKDDQDKKIYTVNGNKILKTDVNTSNGIVHVIDKVLYPIAPRNVWEVVARNSKFTARRFMKYAMNANMLEKLKYDEPLTVFMPIDQAFKSFPDYFAKGLFDSLPAMAALVNYHMANGTFYFPIGANDHRIKSLQGSILEIKTPKEDDGRLMVNKGAKILATYATSNGVVHFVDAVLTPEANPRQMLYSYKEHNIAPKLIRRHRK